MELTCIVTINNTGVHKQFAHICTKRFPTDFPKTFTTV